MVIRTIVVFGRSSFPPNIRLPYILSALKYKLEPDVWQTNLISDDFDKNLCHRIPFLLLINTYQCELKFIIIFYK